MSQFPNQKLTRKEIIKEHGSLEDWAEAIFTSIASIALISNRTSNVNPHEKEVLVDLANGIVDLKDFEYVTKPYGELSPDYPASFRHYDRISSKLHLLMGEEIKRPLNFRAVAVNPEAVTEIEEATKTALRETIMSNLEASLKQNGSIPLREGEEQPEVQEPAEVLEFMRTKYQDSREKQASMALEWLKEYSDLKENFNKGWEWLYTTGDDIFYTGIAYNEPNFRPVDPRHFEFDRSPDIEYIEDAQWAWEERWIPSSQVYVELGEFLSDDDMDTVEKIKGTFSQNIGYGSGIPTIYMNESDSLGSSSSAYQEMNSNSIVKIVNFCWKGLRKIGFVTYMDEESGEPLEKMVGEDYKRQPEDLDIQWDWINEVWEGTKIGEDLYVGVRPRPNQYKSLDNPNKCRLPYTGISNPNLSVVKRVKEIQYLYDIIMYRMELAIARAKGKLMVMDTAQIPTTEGIDLDKWIYYADTSGFAFINSMEEGKGHLAGQRPGFNQFTQIDLTLSNTIQQYIGIMDKLDHLIEDITGVTPQRQGQIHQSETVGGVERSVVQSSAITEYLFYTHSRVKRRVLTNLIEECKICWMEGKKTQYVMDDMTRKILSIDGELFNEAEYGIFISDSQKGAKIKQSIEELAQVALQQQQADLKDIIEILETDSIATAKSVLRKSKEESQKREDEISQQQNEAQQQAQQQAIEMAREDREDKQAHEKELKQMDMDIKREELDNKITLKEIESFRNQMDQDVNNNGVPDQLEIERVRLEERKDVRKNIIEDKKIILKEKELKIKEKDLAAKRNKPKAKS